MGKFYELFDMDAEVGTGELGLSMMKSKRLHAGFPEKAFDKYAAILVHKGYKVGRIEQMETPAQLKERNKNLPKGKKKIKVVDRAMCSLLTKGTLVDQSLIGEFLSLSLDLLLLLK